MSLYKQNSVITTLPESADAQPSEPSAAGPGHDVPRVPAAGDPIDATPPATPPKASGAGAADLWSNGRWAVTEAGLESRVVINEMLIEYLIEKDRLLRVKRGTSAVSMWGAHLAEKSWVQDIDPFVDALAEALRRHHPGRKVIDIDATREDAQREWRRRHERQIVSGPLGHEYEIGEATLRRLAQRDAESKAVIDGRSTAPGALHEPWVAPIVKRIRDALVRHGVDPSAHPAGSDVNERVAAMAMRGATDEELKATADQLKHDYIICDEEPEEDEIEMPFEAEYER